MPVPDYKNDPELNTSIGAIGIGEGVMAVADINNAIRILMADIKAMYDALPNSSAFMSKAGGAFTGDVRRDGKGGFIYHASASMLGGEIITQAINTPLPAAAPEGTIVLEY